MKKLSHSSDLLSGVSQDTEQSIKKLRDMFVHVNIRNRVQERDLKEDTKMTQ